jgi:tetratricopeptide (TPR) repeat protein
MQHQITVNHWRCRMFAYFKRRAAARHYQQGRRYDSLHNADAAIHSYDLAIAACPTFALAFLARSLAFFRLGRHEEALADADRYAAIAHRPPADNLAMMHYVRACILSKRKQTSEALLSLNEAIRLKEDPSFYTLRGAIFMRHLHDTNNFVADLQKALQLRPDHLHALTVLARLYATSPKETERNGPQALALAKRGCELTAWKDWILLSILAAAHAECGDFANAVKYARESLEHAPEAEKAGRRGRLQQYEMGEPYRDMATYGGAMAEGPAGV